MTTKLSSSMSDSPKVRLTCYGLHWARMTLDVNFDDLKAADNPEWLKWFAEKQIQAKHGVKMPLKKVEVSA